MIGRVIDSWKYTKSEIWDPLGKVSKAPKDLYIELYQAAMPHFRRQLDYKEDYGTYQSEMAGIWNDPQIARKAFMQLKKDEFKGES